jgi:HEXXH motif-containing protein
MHAGLADSLRHILERCDGVLSFDRRAIERLIAVLGEGQRFPPSTFALYYDLVPALLRDENDRAVGLVSALAQERPADTAMRVLPLGDPALAASEERYLRFLNSDDSCSFDFLPPSPEQVRAFMTQLSNVTDLMIATMPELLAEMRAIISEIILVAGAMDARMRFDGGSCYRLWGALFLNAERHQSRVELLEVLAHESGHSLLFGMSIEEPHILNADAERYASPLRVETRPMDGVFHATYVSARMHWAMSRLIESGLLNEDERAMAMKAREDDRRHFESGLETVAAHARLTTTGKRVMDSAIAYMRSAA